MSTNKIRISVLGCANIAKRSVIPAIKQHPDFELVAVASRTAEKAEQFASLFDCEAIEGYQNILTNNCDAVYIPLPTGLHEEWVLKALEAGKHVFVEKSFGVDLTSTQKILGVAREKQLVAMENFMFPYHSQHAFLNNLLSEGVIGNIRQFKAYFGFPPLPKNNFRYNQSIGGGAILDAAAYTIKVAQVLISNEIEVLSSTMGIDTEFSVDISGSAHVLCNGSVPGHLGWGFSHYYQGGVEIWGSKGKITTNRTYTAAEGFQPSIKVELPGEVREYTLPADNHFLNILNVFSERIRNNKWEASANEVERQSSLLTQITKKAIRHEIRQ